MQVVKISEVKSNPNNPRIIKDDKFKKLVKSIQEFPEMLKLRPIVVNNDMIVLGGNMRLKACKEAGLKEVPIIKAEDLTEQQQKEFIIKDNVGFGEWDWEDLKENWNVDELDYWGLDIPTDKDKNEEDLFNIEIPFYTPSEIKPEITELANIQKSNELKSKIDLLDCEEELKEVLKNRAAFFTDFNFQKIADYYSKSEKEIKELFEDLGMVILAPKEALKKGFIKMSEDIFDL